MPWMAIDHGIEKQCMCDREGKASLSGACFYHGKSSSQKKVGHLQDKVTIFRVVEFSQLQSSI